eukprot:COSAG06_NODE_12530_length_1368_cov_1.520095_2_plen_62_part_00
MSVGSVHVPCCTVADGGLEAACAFLYVIEEGSVELEVNGAIQVSDNEICQDRLGTNRLDPF